MFYKQNHLNTHNKQDHVPALFLLLLFGCLFLLFVQILLQHTSYFVEHTNLSQELFFFSLGSRSKTVETKISPQNISS